MSLSADIDAKFFGHLVTGLIKKNYENDAKFTHELLRSELFGKSSMAPDRMRSSEVHSGSQSLRHRRARVHSHCRASARSLCERRPGCFWRGVNAVAGTRFARVELGRLARSLQTDISKEHADVFARLWNQERAKVHALSSVITDAFVSPLVNADSQCHRLAEYLELVAERTFVARRRENKLSQLHRELRH